MLSIILRQQKDSKNALLYSNKYFSFIYNKNLREYIFEDYYKDKKINNIKLICDENGRKLLFYDNLGKRNICKYDEDGKPTIQASGYVSYTYYKINNDIYGESYNYKNKSSEIFYYKKFDKDNKVIEEYAGGIRTNYYYNPDGTLSYYLNDYSTCTYEYDEDKRIKTTRSTDIYKNETISHYEYDGDRIILYEVNRERESLFELDKNNRVLYSIHGNSNYTQHRYAKDFEIYYSYYSKHTHGKFYCKKIDNKIHVVYVAYDYPGKTRSCLYFICRFSGDTQENLFQESISYKKAKKLIKEFSIANYHKSLS